MDKRSRIQDEILEIDHSLNGDSSRLANVILEGSNIRSDFEGAEDLSKELHSFGNLGHVRRGDKCMGVVEPKTYNLVGREHGDGISTTDGVMLDEDVVVGVNTLDGMGQEESSEINHGRDQEHLYFNNGSASKFIVSGFNGEIHPEIVEDGERLVSENHECHHQLVNGSENCSFLKRMDNGIEAKSFDGAVADFNTDSQGESVLQEDMITKTKFFTDETKTNCQYIEVDVQKFTVEAGNSFHVNTAVSISEPLDSNIQNDGDGKPESVLSPTGLEHIGSLAEIDSLTGITEKFTPHRNEVKTNINVGSCLSMNHPCVENSDITQNGVSDLAFQNGKDSEELELEFRVGVEGKSGDDIGDGIGGFSSASSVFKSEGTYDLQRSADAAVISENSGVLNGGEDHVEGMSSIRDSRLLNSTVVENSVVDSSLVNGNADNCLNFDDRSNGTQCISTSIDMTDDLHKDVEIQGIGTSVEMIGDVFNHVETEGSGTPFEMTGDMRKAVEIQDTSIETIKDVSNTVETQGVHTSGKRAGNVCKAVETEENTKVKSNPTSSVGRSTDPTVSCPAGLGSSTSLLEPAPRAVQQTRTNACISQPGGQDLVETPPIVESEEIDETREKLQTIRVKFLRLAHRLGQTPHNVVVAQVLYRLGLAEQLHGRNGGRVGAFSFDRASGLAEQLENSGEPLDFSCTVMVIGKTGVGKSSTINSIFDEVKFTTNAFHQGTKNVQDVLGSVQRIKVRIIDTPGLFSSWSDQRKNEKMLQSVKRFIKKNPPDIVWYLDRLDMQSREFGDMPLLHTITDVFGPSIWLNAIVVLTHAASAPPDGPNGMASSYDMFITQRSHVVQQAIRQVAGDMRLMNPVAFVENHSACRTDRAGQRVLPNGQVWKPHLLLFSFASKILAEANTLLKLQDTPPGKAYTTRSRIPPLPFLLSSLIQSRPQLELPGVFFGEGDTMGGDDMDEESESEDESEYEELPPFKCLTKSQLQMLTKSQRNAYFDELEYREKLFMKKQFKEEKKRRKTMAKMADISKEFQGEYRESVDEDGGGAASVPVPMPDLALPYSFDSENPTHRYRHLDSSHQWLVRPVLETHGWDHDVGYEGMNVEKTFVVKGKLPVSFSGQVSKDKKDANLQMEIVSSVKHGEGKGTTLCFDMQTAGKDMLCTVRSDTRFSNCKRNKATAGLSATLLGESLSAGVKLEDKLIISKRLHLAMTGGAMTNRGDVAYGGSLEATLRDKNYPSGQSSSTMGLSVMDWHEDLAIGCNFQSLFPIGRLTSMSCKANLNNKGAGQVAIKFTSSEHLQIALLIGFIPLLGKLIGYQQRN